MNNLFNEDKAADFVGKVAHAFLESASNEGLFDIFKKKEKKEKNKEETPKKIPYTGKHANWNNNFITSKLLKDFIKQFKSKVKPYQKLAKENGITFEIFDDIEAYINLDPYPDYATLTVPCLRWDVWDIPEYADGKATDESNPRDDSEDWGFNPPKPYERSNLAYFDIQKAIYDEIIPAIKKEDPNGLAKYFIPPDKDKKGNYEWMGDWDDTSDYLIFDIPNEVLDSL